MRRLLLAPLLSPLVLAPIAAAAVAQDLAPLRRQADACLAIRQGPPCQAALDVGHQLKQTAEKRQQWRCYTSLLAVEAAMIAHNLGGGSPAAIDLAFVEASQACAGR